MVNHLSQKQTLRLTKKPLIIGGALFILGSALVYIGLTQKPRATTLKEEKSYTQITELVADKLSKSAAIVLNIPNFTTISLAQAEKFITFTPEIKGSFKQGEALQKLVFTPDKPLETGKYYAVSLTTPSGAISKDFFVDENPRVTAIFPKADAEASEYSQITIVFNRPMVPLTTLDEASIKNIPVTITPQTDGKFKWISTRTLQFSPTDHLQRSTNYTVEIPSNTLISFDDVPAEGALHTFTIRPLRYLKIDQPATTSYNSFLSIRFNQPVNLEKTKAQITLERLEKVYKAIPFIAEYATLWREDETTKKTIEEVDKTTLNIYPARDSKGREKFWDFNQSYKITIAGATPEEGGIALSEQQIFTVTVDDVIASIKAESKNSSYLGQTLFDPQGKILVASSQQN